MIDIEGVIQAYRDGTKVADIAKQFGCAEKTIYTIIEKAQKQGIIIARPSIISTIDAESVIKAYEDGIKVTDIAKQFGCSKYTIYTIISNARNQGITIQAKQVKTSKIDTEGVVQAYNDGTRLKDIAKQFSCSRTTIYTIIEATQNQDAISLRNPKFEIDVEGVIQVYKDGTKVNDIAKQFGCSRSTIYIIIGKAQNQDAISLRKSKIEFDIEAVIQTYKDGTKLADIAKQFGCCKTTVSQIISNARKQGIVIARRKIKRTAKIDTEGVIQAYKEGIKVTDIAKQFGCAESTIYKITSKAQRRGIVAARSTIISKINSDGTKIKNIAEKLNVSTTELMGLLEEMAPTILELKSKSQENERKIIHE